MDLSQYKKAWKNQSDEENKVSALEIYKMTQAKSTSIVKWIFIIGLLEFIFWTIINYFASKLEYTKIYDELGLAYFFEYSYYLSYVVVVVFLYIFYKNYTSISTTDSTKILMKKIIRVRKTVKFYVFFNISLSLIAMIIINILVINTPNGIETLLKVDSNTNTENLTTIYVVSQVIGAIIMILILFLFYYLLYGILLKKLKKNYKELNRLEELN